MVWQKAHNYYDISIYHKTFNFTFHIINFFNLVNIDQIHIFDILLIFNFFNTHHLVNIDQADYSHNLYYYLDNIHDYNDKTE